MMCRGEGGAATGSTNPRDQASSSPAASSRSSSRSARNRQLRRVPGRRPLRPSRCRNAATVSGALTWITRSRSPTSMPELERGRGHDHAVPALGERQLRPPPLVKRQRRVDQVRGDAELPQLRAELLDEPLGVAEDQALLAPVQRRDDLGGVFHGPHVVQLDVRVRCGLSGGDRLGFVRTVPACCRALRFRLRRDDDPGALPGGRSLQPRQQLAPGCRRSPTARSAGAGGPRCATAVPGRRAGASPGPRRRRHAPRPRSRPAGRRTAAGGPRSVLTSMDSSDSGVVSSRSGGSASMDLRRDAGVSPCQSATRRPTQAP